MNSDSKTQYVLSLKDICTLESIPELIEAGIHSFKIEGRMKSPYYLATVIGAYRRFMDGAPLDACDKELSCVAHRDYTTAYAFGKNAETIHYADSQSKGDCVYIAGVLDSEDGYATVEMRNRFKKGDVLEVLAPHEGHGKSFTVNKIIAPDGGEVDDAKLVQSIYKIACPYPLKKGDFLRKRVR